MCRPEGDIERGEYGGDVGDGSEERVGKDDVDDMRSTTRDQRSSPEGPIVGRGIQ